MSFRLLSRGGGTLWLAAVLASYAPWAVASPRGDAQLRVPGPDKADGDGVYGRLDGDLSLALQGLAEFDFSRGNVRPMLLGTLKYYQTLGLAVGLSQAVASSDPIERRLTASLVLEPLFLLRWPKYQHSGNALLDLTLDSLQIHAGVALREPRGRAFASQVAANVGFGLGVPLQKRAEGLWVRSRIDIELGSDNTAALWLIGLEWQGFFESPWLRSSAPR